MALLVVHGAGALLRDGIESDSAKRVVLSRSTVVRSLETAVDGSGKARVRVVALESGAVGWGSSSVFRERAPAAELLEWSDDVDAPPWEAGESLAPYISTPVAHLDEALGGLARVGPEDVVVDLGCGDGRIPVWTSVGPRVIVRHLESRCDSV